MKSLASLLPLAASVGLVIAYLLFQRYREGFQTSPSSATTTVTSTDTAQKVNTIDINFSHPVTILVIILIVLVVIVGVIVELLKAFTVYKGVTGGIGVASNAVSAWRNKRNNS